jgi:hypothetical protein
MSCLPRTGAPLPTVHPEFIYSISVFAGSETQQVTDRKNVVSPRLKIREKKEERVGSGLERGV